MSQSKKTPSIINNAYLSDAGDLGALKELKSRLSSKAKVLSMGDPDWVERLAAYSPQGEQTPAFVVECATEGDVVEALSFARTLNLPVVARNGAHNLAELSNVQGGVIISQGTRTGVKCSTADKTVTFEGGCKFSHIDEHLWSNAAGWVMQSAMIQSIGSTGSHFAVGVGWLQRLVGNGIDNIVSVRVVLADGSIVTASEAENSDLWWALRGAAPCFGIVVEMTERIHNICDPVQGKEVRYGQYFFELDHAEKVSECINRMNNDPEFPDAAFLLPIVMFVGGKKGVMLWYAQYMYDSEKSMVITGTTRWEVELRDLAKAEGGMPLNHYAPKGATDHDGWESVTHMELQLLFAPPWCASYYPTGGFVARSKADATFKTVVDHWRKATPEGAEDVPFFTTAFYHFGGKAQVERSPSAWPGNNETNWLCATWGGWLVDQELMQRATRKAQTIVWVDKLYETLRFDLQFGYICAAAFNWRSINHARWIHGPSFDKLTEIKEKYDPDNVFSHNVNVPPKGKLYK